MRGIQPFDPVLAFDLVVGSSRVADAVVGGCHLVLAVCLARLACKRREAPFGWRVALFALFACACGCGHVLEACQCWHGVLAGAGLKLASAGTSLMAMWFLLGLLPKLLALPSLGRVLTLAGDLSWARQEKQRMAGQLQESRDRYRLLVEGIQDYAIILLDPKGLISSWNPGAERIEGYASGEILGQSFARLFPEEAVAAGQPEQLLQRAALEGRSEDEGWRVRKGGQHYFGHTILAAFLDPQGALRGFTMVTRDSTEQRANRAALLRLTEQLEDQVKAQSQEFRESEARLQGFIRHAPAGIAFKGLDGRFLLVNPKMEAILGRPAQEIIGRRSQELFPPEFRAKAEESDQRVLSLRQEYLVEEAWTYEDGSSHLCLVQKFPLVDGTGQCWGLGVIATDITERRQAELAQLQSQKLESLGVLAGGIAHDFNNLLGAMLGNVELALAETAMARARPYLGTLHGLMVKASEQLRRMLAYAGQSPSSRRSLDLNQLVTEMTQLLGSILSKKAAIQLDLHPRALPVTGDPPQLQQVIMNLVINASEALAEGCGLITIRTRLTQVTQAELDLGYRDQGLAPGPYAALEVADNGVGMTQEVLNKIFEPFFTTKFTGRGLGLSALHGIVRGHHGGLRVESVPGRGSSFQLLFPAASGPVLPLPAETLLPRPRSAPARQRGTALVVDDEASMRAVLAKVLTREGFTIVQARDGQEALQVCQQQPQLQLIVMDLTMPTMDGEEACRELQRRGATVPVILCSGFSETDALLRFQGLDLAGFLQKPFGLGTLVALVNRVLPGQ